MLLAAGLALLLESLILLFLVRSNVECHPLCQGSIRFLEFIYRLAERLYLQ
ncbi:MAG: hypothetical protein Ct9H300mP16_09310 [Pseudomonadota bacterium]|nr:MAG: hypothetical protein Ct9H300mP16_09310 [Pseudomonadota bacterium]